MSASSRWITICLCFFFAVAMDLAADDSLLEANRLFMCGRYGEADELFQRLATDRPAAATIGRVRCATAVGRYDDARALLSSAAESHPDDASLQAELALLAWQRGDYERTSEFVTKAIGIESGQTLARWLSAELDRVHGRMAEAERGYEWLIDQYNTVEDLTPEQTYWIGQGAAVYARWTRNSKQFSFLVNTLFPETLQADEHFWPAKLATGRLFAEKYNEADARSELSGGLAINPNSAELHAAAGRLAVGNFDLRGARCSLERALEINPKLLAAWQLKADILLADLQLPEAIEVLEETRRLNPRDEATLGRLAAAYGAADGLVEPAPDSRLVRLSEQVHAVNPHCGEFYMAMGDSLDRMRLYPYAARYYRLAAGVMPRLMYAKGQLGLILMRLAEEEEAAVLLKDAFDADPFNVRVKNMLEVLDLLETYATLESEHFIIRFDGEHDRILAEFALRYLEEEAYPEVVASLGYEPEGKSLFEFFSRAKNSSGHSWFSARMVGLPFIGTVAACAGRMVAVASPNDLEQKFDWSRVLKHEFVHVVNLQQTHFAIPHWFTEALAVLHEELPRPEKWEQVLAQRAQAGALFDLDSINLGFIRPKDPGDWTLAYCQAELYAEYMQDRFGERAIGDMLAAYSENKTTRQAISDCFGVDQEDFEEGYQNFLQTVVGAISLETDEEPMSFSALQKDVKNDPDSADAWAHLALAYLQRDDAPRARLCAVAARKREVGHGLAGYVLARVYLSIGDTRQALDILEESLDETDPQENVLALLAGLRLRSEQFDEAERLYEIGAERWANSEIWLKSLTRVYLKSGDQRKLRACLARLAQRDFDDFLLRKKLAELALDAEDAQDALRWGREAMRIDVMDAEVHAAVASALHDLSRWEEAIDAWEVALRIAPERADWQIRLARTLAAADQRERAEAVLEKLLEREPNNGEARETIDELREQGG